MGRRPCQKKGARLGSTPSPRGNVVDANQRSRTRPLAHDFHQALPPARLAPGLRREPPLRLDGQLEPHHQARASKPTARTERNHRTSGELHHPRLATAPRRPLRYRHRRLPTLQGTGPLPHRAPPRTSTTDHGSRRMMPFAATPKRCLAWHRSNRIPEKPGESPAALHRDRLFLPRLRSAPGASRYRGAPPCAPPPRHHTRGAATST